MIDMINIHTFNDFRYRSSDKIGIQLNTCKQIVKIFTFSDIEEKEKNKWTKNMFTARTKNKQKGEDKQKK